MQHLLRDEWARAAPLPRSAAGGLRRAHVAWENARAACARSLALAAGFAALLHSAVSASGGYDRIFAFGRMEQHRYTAMALLTGTLRLRTGLAHARFDEQVHDGAVYTNWGYGVPFLQAPFHALAHALAWPGGFFPDRAIFLLYASGAIALLWAGFDRMLSTGGIVPVAGRRHAVSWAATLLVLCCALYPLTSCRFLVYEETIAYFVLAQLAALGAYLFGRPAWRSGAVAAVALAAGIGVLIRPTGLVYSAVWCALVAIGSRRWRATAVFAGVHAPLLALWAWLNGVRSGHLFALGYANTMPTFDYHTPIERFGSACNATPADALDGALHLLRALFVDVTPSPGGWLSD